MYDRDSEITRLVLELNDTCNNSTEYRDANPQDIIAWTLKLHDRDLLDAVHLMRDFSESPDAVSAIEAFVKKDIAQSLEEMKFIPAEKASEMLETAEGRRSLLSATQYLTEEQVKALNKALYTDIADSIYALHYEKHLQEQSGYPYMKVDAGQTAEYLLHEAFIETESNKPPIIGFKTGGSDDKTDYLVIKPKEGSMNVTMQVNDLSAVVKINLSNNMRDNSDIQVVIWNKEGTEAPLPDDAKQLAEAVKTVFHELDPDMEIRAVYADKGEKKTELLQPRKINIIAMQDGNLSPEELIQNASDRLAANLEHMRLMIHEEQDGTVSLLDADTNETVKEGIKGVRELGEALAGCDNDSKKMMTDIQTGLENCAMQLGYTEEQIPQTPDEWRAFAADDANYEFFSDRYREREVRELIAISCRFTESEQQHFTLDDAVSVSKKLEQGKDMAD